MVLYKQGAPPCQQVHGTIASQDINRKCSESPSLSGMWMVERTKETIPNNLSWTQKVKICHFLIAPRVAIWIIMGFAIDRKTQKSQNFTKMHVDKPKSSCKGSGTDETKKQSGAFCLVILGVLGLLFKCINNCISLFFFSKTNKKKQINKFCFLYCSSF